MVHCQDGRSLTANRAIARKLLEKKVEFHVLGSDSRMGRAIAKARKQKARSARRRRAGESPGPGGNGGAGAHRGVGGGRVVTSYGGNDDGEDENEDDDEDDDDDDDDEYDKLLRGEMHGPGETAVLKGHGHARW